VQALLRYTTAKILGQLERLRGKQKVTIFYMREKFQYQREEIQTATETEI
jgi:hypothetical protein